MMSEIQSEVFKLELVKPAFDVTLSVNNIDEILAFWQDRAGLVAHEKVLIREGLTQHRHRVGNSIVKMNHHAKLLPKDGSTGYVELLIARAGVKSSETLTDPEGNRVTIEPLPPGGTEHIGFRLQVRDLDTSRKFFGDEMGLPVTNSGSTRVDIGESFLVLDENRSAPADPSFDGTGWRYPTIQVADVEFMHRRMVERRWREGLPLKAFGTAVRFCFARDPDGNWIEFIQRS
jgi:lactoylglutathione lyase